MVIALCLYKVLIAIFHVIQITQINQQYCVKCFDFYSSIIAFTFWNFEEAPIASVCQLSMHFLFMNTIKLTQTHTFSQHIV